MTGEMICPEVPQNVVLERNPMSMITVCPEARGNLPTMGTGIEGMQMTMFRASSKAPICEVLTKIAGAETRCKLMEDHHGCIWITGANKEENKTQIEETVFQQAGRLLIEAEEELSKAMGGRRVPIEMSENMFLKVAKELNIDLKNDLQRKLYARAVKEAAVKRLGEMAKNGSPLEKTLATLKLKQEKQ